MANLATFDMPTTLKDSAKLLALARVLLGHFDQATTLPFQQPLRHITDYMIGELEKCRSLAFQTQTLKLAAGTRNLFELSFTVEFVCASDQNMERFIVDAAIDELEIMQEFAEIDKRVTSYQPDQKSQQREQALKSQIAEAKLTGNGPLRVIDIAKAVNRESEYRALYKVYSKMTHATSWAILGECSWENMALLLLLKANGYVAQCIKPLSAKVGLGA